ncbi:OmpA family protein [Oceaniserpentilla sp. 4NH20-0058]|uniref:OmpA/MotB family protein n=1 Tax=Oceaniserpentilla sp. 4NH20-0058 TaxID=3127660 RepID=UPI00310BD307
MSSNGSKRGLRRRRATFDADGEGWIVTYADAITLLLAFFVMILSVSDLNQGKIEALKEGLASIISGKEAVTPFNDIKDALDDIVQQHNMKDNVAVDIDMKGVRVEFSNFSLYDSGSASIKAEALPMLKEVTEVIKSTSHETHLIEIEGHTDDVPIHTERFPSNWELSASRASNVVKYLMSKGVDKERLKASGYADSRPKVEIKSGEPISEDDRAANRRVVIYVRRF